VLIHRLVTAWGDAGFEAFVARVQAKYAAQAAAASAAAAAHLSDLVECAPVVAGMFLWCRLTGEEGRR
jgi:DNA-binding transcriptional MocR family regulator